MKNLITLMTIGLMWSCGSEKCADNTICTKIFKSVVVQVQNQTGEAVSLDSSATYKSGEIIFSMDEMEENLEYYVVLNDSHKDLIETSGTEVIFKGWRDGEALIEETYIIGHDCCHIIKIEGPDTITVTLD